MKEQFKSFNFKGQTLAIIDQANDIIETYMADGFDLTLRQLYYQFVARDIIENSQKSYDKLGVIINNARLNGDIDWEAIKDRTRQLEKNSHWRSPAEIISTAARSFRIDTRATQDTYLEVWVEKEALVGVVERACTALDIPYFACRGYVSQTAMYDAAQRISSKDKHSVILHLGDHDPSGIDMTRDIEERLNEAFDVSVEVKRIALNMDQVEHYGPPPNPAKLTDSRCDGYIKRYGSMSWELDALDPNTLTRLITAQANSYTDQSARDLLLEKQAEHRQILNECSSNWEEVVEYLNNRG